MADTSIPARDVPREPGGKLEAPSANLDLDGTQDLERVPGVVAIPVTIVRAKRPETLRATVSVVAEEPPKLAVRLKGKPIQEP